MKYLLFNVVVVAALAYYYLFVGGGPTDPVEAWLPDRVNTVIADVRGRLSPAQARQAWHAAISITPAA